MCQMREELSDNFAALERTPRTYLQNRRQIDLPEEPMDVDRLGKGGGKGLTCYNCGSPGHWPLSDENVLDRNHHQTTTELSFAAPHLAPDHHRVARYRAHWKDADELSRHVPSRSVLCAILPCPVQCCSVLCCAVLSCHFLSFPVL